MRRNSFNRKLRRALAASLGAFAFASSAYVAEAAEDERKKLIEEIIGFFADPNNKHLLKASRVLPPEQPQGLPDRLDEVQALINRIPPIIIQGKSITLNPDMAAWMNQSLKTEIKVDGNPFQWKVVLRDVGYVEDGGDFHPVGFVILPTNQKQDLDWQKKHFRIPRGNTEQKMLEHAHKYWKTLYEQIQKKRREKQREKQILKQAIEDLREKPELEKKNYIDADEGLQKWRDKWDADKPNRAKRKREKENAIKAKLAAEKEKNQNNNNYSSHFSSAGSTNYSNPISSFNPAVSLAGFAATLPAMTNMIPTTAPANIQTPATQITAGPTVTTPVGPQAGTTNVGTQNVTAQGTATQQTQTNSNVNHGNVVTKGDSSKNSVSSVEKLTR